MRQRSEWREFGFALHQVQNAIEPSLPLAQVLSGWNRLAAGLAESHRNRAAQDRNLNLTGEVHPNAYPNPTTAANDKSRSNAILVAGPSSL
jgi:hypothetical protein